MSVQLILVTFLWKDLYFLGISVDHKGETF